MMNLIFLILAFALTAILVPVTIPLLKRMKFGQSIRKRDLSPIRQKPARRQWAG